MNSKFLLLGLAFIITNATTLSSVFGSKDVLERQLVHEERDENIRNTIDGRYLSQGKIAGDLTWHFGGDAQIQPQQQPQEDSEGFPKPLEE